MRKPPIRGDEVVLDAEKIGRTIRRLRNERGLSQEVFSGLAALDRTHYSKIERGLRTPSLETIFKIAQALEMRPSDLVREIEKDLMK